MGIQCFEVIALDFVCGPVHENLQTSEGWGDVCKILKFYLQKDFNITNFLSMLAIYNTLQQRTAVTLRDILFIASRIFSLFNLKVRS